MAHFGTLPGTSQAGFDRDRFLQVVPVRQTRTVYLFAGADLDVRVEQTEVATLTGDRTATAAEHRRRDLTSWEREVDMRRLVVRGERPGTTRLVARQASGAEFARALEIRVVDDQDARQAGGIASISPGLRTELAAMRSTRDAVIRVAEDQMHSAVVAASDAGFGRYCSEPGADWCGAFAWWCWNVATAARSVDNPFGRGAGIDRLLSPQKALHFARTHPDRAIALRFQDRSDPFHGPGEIPYVEIDALHPVERGDICLVRNAHGGWQHVCLVHTPPSAAGGDFVTIDGNQGQGNCIRTVSRSRDHTVLEKAKYKYAFLHVLAGVR